MQADRFKRDKAELLQLLLKDGILHRTPTQPVLSRDGTSARWMLDSLCVSLTPRGIELAGQCLLRILERFEGRQIATLGTTGIPLLSSCLLQSQGRYRGLLVRKERKPHGSRKLIEGVIDPSEPIVILDDSVSSGLTMTQCSEMLEEAGLCVEGGLCLVRFGWYGGFARMRERGYRMDSLFDIYRDFMHVMEDEPEFITNPTKQFSLPQFNGRSAAEGLSPAVLARAYMEEWLRDESISQPPQSLDAGYDSSGGVWISVRSRRNIYLRHAREGFWHFPGEEGGPAGRDLALAAVQTARKLPQGQEGLRVLDESAIAVTFFSELEECRVGELDNDRYGIVVRSRERPSWMGGALPRMPGITNAWQQFQHARRRNGRLVSFEPYELFRHDVVKVVESDVKWQPTGVPEPSALRWHEDPSQGGRIAQRARELVLSKLTGRNWGAAISDEEAIPEGLDRVFVTVLSQGRVIGCMGSPLRQVEKDLAYLTQCALSDERFGGIEAGQAESDMAVSLSLLLNPLELGEFSPEDVMRRVRLGEQCLQVQQRDRDGLLLPQVASQWNLDDRQYALEVIDKAGVTRPPYLWKRWDCTSWLAEGNGRLRMLRGGFPVPEEPPALEEALPRLAELQTAYLMRNQREDGSLFMRYRPFQDVLYERIDLPRFAHAAWVMARAGSNLNRADLVDASLRLLDFLLKRLRRSEEGGYWLEAEGHESCLAEVAFLLLAICRGGMDQEKRRLAGEIADWMWTRIGPHGRIATHKTEQKNADIHQDYVPGQVLLALAAAAEKGVSQVRRQELERAFRYYRRRFRNKPDFGQVSWQMQGFTDWHRQLGDEDFPEFVFEVGDWILGYQQRGGGFINDHQPDSPGYTTALYLEGVGTAWQLALAKSDFQRAGRYEESCRKGFRFLDRLLIQERDAVVLPNSAWALGGLRQSLQKSEIRIDFVQHGLSAVLEALQALQSVSTSLPPRS